MEIFALMNIWRHRLNPANAIDANHSAVHRIGVR
jgi:hypothetical protein